MFKIGDYAVCPGHGVGQVCDIQEKTSGTSSNQFYILRIISNGMTIMVPTNTKDGIRELVSLNEVEEVYSLLCNHQVEVDNSTWNRRYREYMLKIKTGSLKEIAEVLRALFLLKKIKNLSFGEKKMLDQCKDLLAQEISLAKSQDKNEIKSKIDSHFSSLT